jgi:hypothetical protein
MIKSKEPAIVASIDLKLPNSINKSSLDPMKATARPTIATPML